MLTFKSVVTTVVILFIAIFVYKHLGHTEAPILTVENGKIKGIILSSRQGREYSAYFGIPYAAPPEGELRFQPPQPAKSWAGILDASKFGPLCAQYDFVARDYKGVEDCLFLNVFSPKINQENSTSDTKDKLLPVVVYFHGGYFHLGGPYMHDPSYMMDTNVILVTVAYRLGAFGFLSTGDEEVPGNMGLKDQLLSLIWTKKNIHNFRGDPNQVTICGVSAGGASVHYHVLSSKSKGLFRRAISSSGTALAAWANYNKPKEQAQRLAERLNCPTENSTALIACLQTKSAQEIGYTSIDTTYPSRTRIDMFVPVVESAKGKDQFLSKTPAEILKSGEFNRVPWLSGVMESEGTYFAVAVHTNATFRNYMETQWDRVSAGVLNVEDYPEIAKRLRSQYVKSEESSGIDLRTNFESYVRIVSDSAWNFPLQSSAQLQSKFSPVYLYYFNYCTEYSFVTMMDSIRDQWPIVLEIVMSVIKNSIYRNLLGTYPPFHAISHGDDIPLQFPMPLPGLWIAEGHRDYEMSRDLVKCVADFASVEDLRDLSFRNVTWKPVINSGEVETQAFMEISDKPSMIIPPYVERLKFWNQYHKY